MDKSIASEDMNSSIVLNFAEVPILQIWCNSNESEFSDLVPTA